MHFTSNGKTAFIQDVPPFAGTNLGTVNLRSGILMHIWFHRDFSFPKVPSVNTGLYRPLLTSQLQKCVRRGKTTLGVLTARALLASAPGTQTLLRRLSIIAVEDVGSVNWLPQLVWFMCAALKDERLLRWPLMLNWLLGAVANLCDCTTDDQVEDCTVAQAIRVRVSYGGTRGDLRMLEQKAVGSKALACDPVVPMSYADLEPLRHTEILSCAADFHCLPRLPKRVARRCDDLTPEQIKQAMWHCSSSLNVRAPRRTEAYRTWLPLWKRIKATVKEEALEALQRR